MVLTAVLAGLMDMGIEGLKARVRWVLVNPGFSFNLDDCNLH